VSVGALTNVACALIGCYLVLRQMSLMGDALSHAVLPGLVLAFVFSGSLGILPLFLGAVAVGLLTTFLTQTLHQYGKVHTDASMGVVFTSLFALGVVLLKRYITGMHFDVACVYQGSLLQVALNTVPVGNVEVPRQLFTIGPVLLANVVFITLFWKELKITSFDPGLAYTVGVSATGMHYALMAIVAVTTVASFEAVGSILVVAMLIVPGATAHLLTDRLGRMLLIAALIAVAAAVVGYALASWWQVEPSGAMTVVAGMAYALAVFFSPRYGVVSKLVNNFRTSLRVVREDVMAMLYRVEEVGGARRLAHNDASKAVGGGLLAAWGIRSLVKTGQVVESAAGLNLTETGRQHASQLVRSHRLWESYLVQQLGLPADHVHEPAERVEHFIDDRMRAALERELGDTSQDPHGREIPEP
jgi:manganese/zinc/iron transport system permease protein